MRIALDVQYRDHCGNRFSGHELSFFDRRTVSRDEFVEQVRDADVIGMGRAPSFVIDRGIIEQLPRVQFIHKSGSGLDHFDVDALTDHGILLATNKGFNASSVAEHALTLILLTMRNTLWHIDNLRNGQWVQDDPPGGVLSIRGKTVGIVGLGESGSYLAQAVLALGARVIAYQRNRKPEIEILGHLKWASSLDELLQECDIVSLHVPHTRETHYMIGARELALMKPSAVLINCARGKVVDEAALIAALASGRLRAAGIDVFEQEPTPLDNPLLHSDRVIATAHVAGGTAESRQFQVEGTLSNIERFVSGKVPLRLANPEILKKGARATHLTGV